MASQMSSMTDEEIHFRLSKKIAELTKVVHLLFMKNREREVEIEAIKVAYEEEINSVIDDARSRINKLDNKIIEVQQNHEVEMRQIHQEYSQQLQDRDINFKKVESSQDDEKDQLRQKNELLNRQLKALAEEHDMLLVKMDRDIKALTDDHNAVNNQLNEEIGRLNQQIHDSDGIVTNLNLKLQQVERENQQQIETLNKQLADITEEKEASANKVKKLDNEAKALKQKLEEKSRISPKSEMFRVAQKYEDEIARLKKEVQKFRMELVNREENYNRIFAEQQPILIDQTPIKQSGYPALHLSMNSKERTSVLPSIGPNSTIVGSRFAKRR